MVRTVFFDLDQTLLQTDLALETAIKHVCAEVIKTDKAVQNLLYEKVRHYARMIWYDSPASSYIKQIEAGSSEGLCSDFSGINKNLELLRRWSNYYKQEVWRNALAGFSLCNDDLISTAVNMLQNHWSEFVKPFPNTELVLRKLKQNFKLVVITNGLEDIQMKKIAAANLTCFFDKIVISGKLGIGKPHKSIFEYALKNAETSAHQAIMIGDNYERDIIGAQNASIKGIWLHPGHKDSSEHSGMCAASLRDCCNIIYKMNNMHDTFSGKNN